MVIGDKVIVPNFLGSPVTLGHFISIYKEHINTVVGALCLDRNKHRIN